MASVLDIPRAPHFYSHFAGQELEWLPMDTHELWQSNLSRSHTRQQLAQHGWLPARSFTYRLNSHGFRCDEFNDSTSILCLGCSFTMGIGLPLEMTWPYLLSQHTGISCWNLGVGGCSADTCYRLLAHYIQYLNPQAVTCFLPSQDRMEAVIDGQHVSLIPQDQVHHPWYKMYLLDQQNAQINREKNIAGMHYLCQAKSIPFVWLCSQQQWQDPSIDKSQARDLAHPGQTYHRVWAERFYSMLLALSGYS